MSGPDTTPLQVDAAICQPDSGIRMGVAFGKRQGIVLPIQVAEWARLSILTALHEWTIGISRTCIHKPAPFDDYYCSCSPHRPQMVVCGDCVPLLYRAKDLPAWQRCAACGQPATSDVQAISYGSLSAHFRTCDDCRPVTS